MILKTEIRDRLRNSYIDKDQKYLLDKCMTEYFKESFEFALSKLTKEVQSIEAIPEKDSSGYICDTMTNAISPIMSNLSGDVDNLNNIETGTMSANFIVEFDRKNIYQVFSRLIIKSMFNFIIKYNPVFLLSVINLTLNSIPINDVLCKELIESGSKKDKKNAVPNVLKTIEKKSNDPDFIFITSENVSTVGLITLSIEFLFNHVDIGLLYDSILTWFKQFKPIFFKIIKRKFSPKCENQDDIKSEQGYGQLNMSEDEYFKLLNDEYYDVFEHIISKTITNYYTGKNTDILFDFIQDDTIDNF